MDDKIRNPFQKEIYDKYMSFIEEGMQYFPNHIPLKIAKSKEPDFKFLIALIFDARAKYPGYKVESLKLCEDIAHFSERNTDKSEQSMFEEQLIRICESDYTNIINQILSPILDQDTIETMTTEISDAALIQKVRLEFVHEEWISQLTNVDIDIDILLAFIMGTEKYINQDKTTLVLVEELAEYANRHIMSEERELFANAYLSDIAVSRHQLLEKYGMISRPQVKTVDFKPTFPPIFEKNPPPYEHVVVETARKQTKNKRKIAELNQLTELLNKGRSFLVSRGPVNKNAGIKRVVVKSCFEDVVAYLEQHLPEKATITQELGRVKISFGKEIVHTEKSKYQRTSR
jgi:hypothetical protein